MNMVDNTDGFSSLCKTIFNKTNFNDERKINNRIEFVIKIHLEIEKKP